MKYAMSVLCHETSVVVFVESENTVVVVGGGNGIATTRPTGLIMNRPCRGNNNDDSSNSRGVTQQQHPTTTTTTSPIMSLSKLTALISAQIENNAWDAAIKSLNEMLLWQQQRRQKQEEEEIKINKQLAPPAPATTKKTSTTKTKTTGCFKPKLGSLQRWVRMIDAAGTDDPTALRVLDAVLRVVTATTSSVSSSESVVGINVSKEDKERAIYKEGTMGHVRLFPPLFELCGGDRSRNGNDKASEEAAVVVVDGDNNHDNNTALAARHDTITPTTLSAATTTPTTALSDIIDRFISQQHVTTNDLGMPIIHDETALTDARQQLFRRCAFEKGCDRKPPNKFDLSIVTTITTTTTRGDGNSHETNDTVLSSSHDPNVIEKIPLPYVSNSFLLRNVVTPRDCHRLLTMAVIAGYHPDEPLFGNDQSSIPAHACVWLVDDALERLLFERVRTCLPTFDDGDERRLRPLGLNRRFRFYRYVPGRYYRPHIDGAWPPSGLDEVTGGYVYDVTNRWNKNGLQFVNDDGDNDDDDDDDETNTTTIETPTTTQQQQQQQQQQPRRQLSKLTFLIYLNDDFEGGCTTFLQPSKDDVGVLDAFPIKPVTGAVLVFPHGTTDAPLHEGSPVVRGCKYVVRTEVEYYC